jgi:hypothetical protein
MHTIRDDKEQMWGEMREKERREKNLNRVRVNGGEGSSRIL